MIEDESKKLKIDDILLSEGMYVGPTVGVSMLPMLKNRRDTIVVKPKEQRLKRLDVALYHRGKDYVLHRVLKVTDEGYVIRGDNTYSLEYIPEDDVIGVLTEFFRKGKHYYCTDKKYIKYAERRIKTYKIRAFFVRIKTFIRRVGSKILRILGIKK